MTSATTAAPTSGPPPAPPPPASATGDIAGAARGTRGGAHLLVRGLTKNFSHGGRVLPVLRGINLELHP